MKSFVLIMLIGVGVATAATIAIARAVLPETAWESSARPTPRPVASRGQRALSEDAVAGGQYTQHEAVETVAERLARTPKGDRMRETLRNGAKVEYHSPGHWTVRLNEASWTAHGVGERYAEPDNDPARVFEHESTGP